jgi:hypothetical protein
MRRAGSVAAALALAALSGCRALAPAPMGPAGAAAAELASLPLDHVILAVDSLERGVALFEAATGVRPAEGGAHPGRGTRNALVSLGSGRYLELVAPNPADTSAAARRLAAGWPRFTVLTPVGWAVHVPDAEAERARLVAAGLRPGGVTPGSRETPGGGLLRWTTLDPWGGAGRGLLPFVISWDAGADHPSTTAPRGCTLAGFRIVSPAADSLRILLSRAGWPAEVAPPTAGGGEELEFALDCPTGRVQFP